MPTFTALSGPSGSGKSTYAAAHLVKNPDCVVLSSDDILEQWAKRDKITYAEAWLAMADKAADAVTAMAKDAFAAGANVIWDQTNLKIQERLDRLSFVPKNYAKEILVFSADIEILKNRIANRRRMTNKNIPDFVLDAQIQQQEFPAGHEGWDIITHVPKQVEQPLLWFFDSNALGGFYQSDIIILARSLDEAIEKIEPMIKTFIAERVEEFFSPCISNFRSDPDDDEFEDEVLSFTAAIVAEAREKIRPISEGRMVLYGS
jgi:predicted kinase